MEINITRFYNEAAPMDYSASIAEIGRNAGSVTWQAAVEDSPDYNMLDTDDKRDAFRTFVRSFGAWTDEEIAAWSDIELNALFIQFVSGDMRNNGQAWYDIELDEQFIQFVSGDMRNNEANRLFVSDDGQAWYDLS